MTQQQFDSLVANSQAHSVFKLDWHAYSSQEFADVFLPKVSSYKCKGVRFYDGAEVLESIKASPRKSLPLAESSRLIDVVAFTFPNGVEAGLKKARLKPARHEVAAFIEVNQAETASISFKFGQNFRDFASEQNLSANTIEEKNFSTNIKSIREYFEQTLTHENMTNFVLDTLGVESSSAYGNTDKGKLEFLMKENKIDGFIYKNQCADNEEVIIQGEIINGLLVLKRINNSLVNRITGLNLAELQNFVALKNNEGWIRSALAIPEIYNNGSCPDIQSLIGKDETSHISDQVTKHINFTKLEGAEKQYEALNNEIAKQLNNPFYKDLNLCVTLSVADNKSSDSRQIEQLDGPGSISLPKINTFTSNFKKNEKPCEISLDITIGSDGKPSIKHRVSPNYLIEFEEKWEQEIKKRGLENEINIQELREQVLKDFQSAETEHNFYERFIQQTKALLSEQVGGYIEAIQATQKIAKNVWDEGQVNESTWYSKDDEHKEWPEYVQLNPVIGGGTDGVVDEIVGIPLAIKSIYGIATDEEQRDAFTDLFTADGFDAILDGIKQQAADIRDDEEIRNHFGSKTVVSIAAMFVPGAQATKLKKLEDLQDMVKKTAKSQTDEFVDGGTTLAKIDKLKKVVRHIETEKALDDLLKEFGSNTFENHLDELLEAANVKSKKEWLKVLAKFKIARKLESNVTDLITRQLTQGGGAYIEQLASKFGKNIPDMQNMQRLTQLQINLPNNTWTVLDDVFVENVFENGRNITKLYINETKLSDLSGLTKNQRTFLQELQNGTVEFTTRSKSDNITDVLKQNSTVQVEKYVKTVGNGLEDATDLKTEILY